MNFRQFVEDSDSLSAVDAFKKIGIAPEDWKSMPIMAANWGTSDVTQNLNGFRILGFEYKDGKPFIVKLQKNNDPTRLNNRTDDLESYKKVGDEYRSINNVPDTKIYRVKISDLTNLYNQPYAAGAQAQPMM